jgi:hypothetical protein
MKNYAQDLPERKSMAIATKTPTIIERKARTLPIPLDGVISKYANFAGSAIMINTIIAIKAFDFITINFTITIQN